MVLKSEEPGSKQKLAMEYGYTESICHDMINHLVNDIVVMGGKTVGGETSIQPSVVESGVYVLTSSIAGIVEKAKVIDGSAIEEGDAILAIVSNVEQIMKPHTPYYKSKCYGHLTVV